MSIADLELTFVVASADTQHGPDGDIPEPDVWHYWVVIPDDWSLNQTLCTKAAGLSPVTVGDPAYLAMLRAASPAGATTYGVTTVPADVTCRDCLDWMHA